MSENRHSLLPQLLFIAGIVMLGCMGALWLDAGAYLSSCSGAPSFSSVSVLDHCYDSSGAFFRQVSLSSLLLVPAGMSFLTALALRAKADPGESRRRLLEILAYFLLASSIALTMVARDVLPTSGGDLQELLVIPGTYAAVLGSFGFWQARLLLRYRASKVAESPHFA